MKKHIGVLALQGGYASHIAVLESLGAGTKEVRTAGDLEGCDAFVIPGGESTVLTRLLTKSGTGPGSGLGREPTPLFEAIREFIAKKPAMGTCAGLIMLARPSGDDRVVPFDALPVTVERNAYGRQTESFIEKIRLELPCGPELSVGPAINDEPYPATFIRAPKISSIGDGVKVLARARGDIVMVQYGRILGLTFHPELTPRDTRIHGYFLSLLE